jgi:hypothetical protein
MPCTASHWQQGRDVADGDGTSEPAAMESMGGVTGENAPQAPTLEFVHNLRARSLIFASGSIQVAKAALLALAGHPSHSESFCWKGCMSLFLSWHADCDLLIHLKESLLLPLVLLIVVLQHPAINLAVPRTDTILLTGLHS